MLDNIHLRLFDAKRLRLPAGAWNTPNVRSAFWRFYWNAGDGAWLQTDDGPYPLQAATPYFVPAGVHFDCHNTVLVEHFYVHFDVLGLPWLMARELFDKPLCLPPTLQIQADVAELAHALSTSDDLNFVRQCQVKGLLYHALTEHLRGIERETLARCGRMTGALLPVLPALEHIEEHLGHSLANAALCHLTPEHFIRRFHALVGQSPAQYVIERRVTIAAQRLLFTDDSIERIADATGFGNRYYFSRVFAKQMGIPPAAYRRSKRV